MVNKRINKIKNTQHVEFAKKKLLSKFKEQQENLIMSIFRKLTGLQPKVTKLLNSNNIKLKNLLVTIPKEFVYHVELNRPEKLNALNTEAFNEIKKCFDFLSETEDCRVVVLSGGSARLFSAGIDLKDLTGVQFQRVQETEDVARKAKILKGVIERFQHSMSSLELCKKPVIAAIHNACIGAGVDLITAADLRYCSKDAYFQVKEVDIGMAADIGTLQRLPKIIGSDSLVRELCYTCRKFPASEALERGLVSKVYDNKDEMINNVIQLAEEIAKKSPVAVQTTKINLVYSRDHSVEKGLEQIALLNQLMLQSEDIVNATVGQLTKNSDIKFSKL